MEKNGNKNSVKTVSKTVFQRCANGKRKTEAAQILRDRTRSPRGHGLVRTLQHSGSAKGAEARLDICTLPPQYGCLPLCAPIGPSVVSDAKQAGTCLIR